MTDLRNILVIKLKHIGDVLLATPVLDTLHQRYPQARITVLVPRGMEAMVANHPAVRDVLFFDRAVKDRSWTVFLRAEWNLLCRLRKAKFDCAIDLSGGDRGAILSFCSGAPLRLGYRRRKGLLFRDTLFTRVVDLDDGKHVIDSHGDILRMLGIDGPLGPPRLFPSAAAVREASNLLNSLIAGEQDRLIVFHPTSRWMFKSWPAEHCARLAEILVQKWNCRVLFTSGPEEKERVRIRQILASVREPVLDLSGKTTLDVLGALISKASAFIGVDSAPMHMACALGIPTLAIFGPSGPVQWAPRGAAHRVVMKRWDCQPCHRDGCQGSKISRCLTELSVEEVCAVLDEWLPGVLGRRRAGIRGGT